MSAVAPAPASTAQKSAKNAHQLAKEKKQKRIVAFGSVILLALLGYQLPKMMGSDTAPPEAPAQTGTAPTVTAADGTPSPASLPTHLSDTDRVIVEPQSGQLLSFGLFKSKDPFVQQIGAPTSPTDPSSTPTDPLQPATPSLPGSPPPRTTAPSLVPSVPRGVSFPSDTPPTPVPTPPAPTPPAPAPTPPPPTPPSTPTPSPPSTPVVPARTPGTVALITNSSCELVPLRGTFPGNEDLFRVAAISKDGKTISIGIVGGAYDGGKAVASLKRGRKVTLVNTADGTRYTIKLVANCDVETEPVKTQPSSAPPPPPAPAVNPQPTPWVQEDDEPTEPIVEDDQDVGEAEDSARG